MTVEDIVKNCEYARMATHTDINPINWGDAEGFFCEGMEYQRRLQEAQLAANANLVLIEDARHDQLLAAEARVAELEGQVQVLRQAVNSALCTDVGWWKVCEEALATTGGRQPPINPVDDPNHVHPQSCGYTVTGRTCNCNCEPNAKVIDEV